MNTAGATGNTTLLDPDTRDEITIDPVRGFIAEELVPTAGKIPAKLWFPVKDAALKYARTAKG
jgi:hypothetical protein